MGLNGETWLVLQLGGIVMKNGQPVHSTVHGFAFHSVPLL